MSKVTCSISNLTFHLAGFTGTEDFPSRQLDIEAESGFKHPIFYASYGELYRMYGRHCKGYLDPVDSYLLFLAFLESSDHVTFEVPCTLNPHLPTTIKLIEGNFRQLVTILEKTAVVSYSSFVQPSFLVSTDTSELAQIPNWILAWEDNLAAFRLGKADERSKDNLTKTTNELSYLILSGADPSEFADTIALWAARAANFPAESSALWQKTIISCFSIGKMFKTPLALLKEIKDYCECNIPAGSIHFHTLTLVLKEGIARHHDYLGGSSLAREYTLLPAIAEVAKNTTATPFLKGDEAILDIALSAPSTLPIRADYPDTVSFIRAKLAFRVAGSVLTDTSNEVPLNESTEAITTITPNNPKEYL